MVPSCRPRLGSAAADAVLYVAKASEMKTKDGKRAIFGD